MKQRILLRTIIICLCLVWATGARADMWFWGLQFGHTIRTGHINSTYNAGPALAAAMGVPQGEVAASKFKISDDGALYGFLAGYDWHWGKLAYGFEGNITIGNIDEHHAHQFLDGRAGTFSFTQVAKLARKAEFGLSGKIGLIHPYFMPYIKVGGQTSNDELLVETAISTINIVDSTSQKRRVYGYHLAAGLEVYLFRDLIVNFLKTTALRAEYKYTRSERYEHNDGTLPILAFHTIRPVVHLWQVGFIMYQ